MALAAFDTHDFVKRLMSAGLAVEVAEVFAKEQSHLIGTIVSKDDLKEHKTENRSDVEHLEERIDSKFDLLRHEIGDLRKDIDVKHEPSRKDIFHAIRELESRLTIRLGRIVFSGVAFISALLVIFKFFLN
jgi:hypothetical protein